MGNPLVYLAAFHDKSISPHDPYTRDIGSTELAFTYVVFHLRYFINHNTLKIVSASVPILLMDFFSCLGFKLIFCS